ncbi:MBL fold metallo-hydrolase [Bacteroidia bacterium]|nr:MBL fold metallo-hydrolase [Bacteroidia bacterium]MDC1395357.1 MBL fold metallo-hydrolase [Bacteroidia bacterium]
MIQVHQLTYGPFAENTYLLSDDENNALVIDPGMYHAEENTRFFEYVNAQGLKLTRMILTHAHLDHVFGVNWINKTYGLTAEVHAEDKFIYDNAAIVATQYGLQMETLVPPIVGLENGSLITFGDDQLLISLVPGHSPGSVCFYSKENNFIIGGDVIFQGSIGRTDLPGGSFDALINSIRTSVLSLPDDVVIYSGHGPITTIGQERVSNPFLIQ